MQGNSQPTVRPSGSAQRTTSLQQPPLTSIIVVLLGLLLAVGVMTFAAPCASHDGELPTCHAAGTAVLRLGIAAAVFAAARLFGRNNKALSIIGSIGAAVCGLVAAVIPGTVLPLCMMATMRCHTVMRPFAVALGLAIAAATLADTLISQRKVSR